MKGGDNSVKSVNKKNKKPISYANVAIGKTYKNIAKTAGIKLEFVENGKNPFLLKYPYSMSREENKITNVLVYNPIYDGLKIQWAKTPTDRGNINPMSHTPNKKKFKYLIDNWDDAVKIIESYKNKNKVINELSDLETDDIKRLLEDLVSKKLYEERAIILHKWLEKHELDVVNSKYKTRAGAQGTFLTPLYQLWYKLYTKLSKPKKSVKKASVKKDSVKKNSNNNKFYNTFGVGINNAQESNNNPYKNEPNNNKKKNMPKKDLKRYDPITGKRLANAWNSNNNNNSSK
jgi:hypothetical protein